MFYSFVEPRGNAQVHAAVMTIRLWQIQYVRTRSFGTKQSSHTIISQALCWEFKSNCALNHSCAWWSSPRDSHSGAQANQTNRVAFPKAQTDPSAQHRERHAAASKHAAAPHRQLWWFISHELNIANKDTNKSAGPCVCDRKKNTVPEKIAAHSMQPECRFLECFSVWWEWAAGR